MALTPGDRIGPYEVLSPLGKGGMGEVYKARDTKLDRDVALKILPESLAADADRLMRFEREAKTLASLNHPNIAQVYGVETSGATQALVMELIQGDDLSARIARGPISADDALPIARQVADALEAAHEQGVIHRDLKPANIKVKDDGTVKVLDFGLAKALGPDQTGAAAENQRLGPGAESPTMTSPALTQMGVILGTAAYMSPEQAKGRPVDRRADIWAFGVVLYEMLTGRQLFEAETVSEALAAVLRADIELTDLPADTPPAVRRLLERCLDRDPRRRLRDIGEARVALSPESLTDDGAAERGPLAPPTPAWQQPVTWVTTALLMLAAAGLSWWSTRPAPQLPPPVTRFSLDLPDRDFFNPTGREIAISPLGSAVVYESDNQLWIRWLNERQSSLLLPSVTDVREPFFSPDGRQIGFFSNDQMMRVPATGGTPDVIGGPIPERPFGVSWATDGYIYVGISGNIARLPERGGDPEMVIEVEPGEQASGPQLMPGGRWLLYTLLSQPDDWDQAQVVAENLATGDRRVLVESGRAGRITPTGHLVYALGGTLYGQPFDARAVTVTGGPIALVSNVRATASNITGGMFFDFTARGDLVYIEDRVEGRNRRLAWLDRIGRETPLPAEPQPFTHVRVSPDGRRFAATLTRNATQSDVVLYDVDRPGAERLTSVAKSEAPEWSPDGDWLYYFATDPGSGNPDGIYRRRADLGTDPQLVLASPDVPVQPYSVTADGRLLAITIFDRQRLGIGIVSLDGAPALTRLSIQGSAEKPSVSPDGRFIAYQVGRGSGAAVEVMEIASRRSVMVSAGLGHDPRWSPNGDEIVFRADDEMKSVRVLSAATLEFTTPATLFRHPSEEFDVAPDGTFLVVLPEQDEPLLARRQIQVVLNWFEELKAKIPR